MTDNEEEGVELPEEELVEDTDVVFFSADGDEILRLCDNGDIFVHGSLAENDKAVVDGLREFLKNAGQIG
jgi:hypothetical protein